MTNSTVIQTLIDAIAWNRSRTLGTLDAALKLDEHGGALGWRPGAGRAHVAWQLMHIAMTEELFATERLFGEQPAFGGLVDAYKGGSTPSDEIPSPAIIRESLDVSRQHLLGAMARLTDADLDTVPEAMKQRGWNIRTVMQVIAWHEGHHQGQAHLTLNLYGQNHPGA